jgi:hypothetical protein
VALTARGSPTAAGIFGDLRALLARRHCSDFCLAVKRLIFELDGLVLAFCSLEFRLFSKPIGLFKEPECLNPNACMRLRPCRRTAIGPCHGARHSHC